MKTIIETQEEAGLILIGFQAMVSQRIIKCLEAPGGYYAWVDPPKEGDKTFPEPKWFHSAADAWDAIVEAIDVKRDLEDKKGYRET